MATIPVPVTQLPMPVPSTQDPANFDVRADAFLGALPLWGDQLNALATVTYNNAAVSEASATAAAASQNAAANSAAAALASQNAAANSAADALASKNAASNSATEAANSATDALASQNAAADSAESAMQYRDEAMVFARTQLVSTSTTSLSVTLGVKNITTQQNKAFLSGQYLLVTSNSSTSNRMEGYLTSYNPATGEMVISVSKVFGSGTFADWSIALTAPGASDVGMTVVEITTDTVAVSGVYYIFKANVTLTLPLKSATTTGFKVGFASLSVGMGKVDYKDTNLKGYSPGIMEILTPRSSAIIQYSGIDTLGYVEI